MVEGDTQMNQTINIHTTGPAIGAALIQARRCGYQDAIDAMQDMAGTYRDAEVRNAILAVALTLKTAKF
jgi:hypothetical protein